MCEEESFPPSPPWGLDHRLGKAGESLSKNARWVSMYLAPKCLLRALFWRLVREARPQNKGSTFLSELFLRDPEYRSGPGAQTNDLPQCSRSTDWASPAEVWGHFGCWQRRWLVNLLKGFIFKLVERHFLRKNLYFLFSKWFPSKIKRSKMKARVFMACTRIWRKCEITYNVSEYRSTVRKKARKELLCFIYGLKYWGHHVKIYSGVF